MKRIVNKARNFKEAEEYEINQYLKMKPEERQEIAKILKIRVYGRNVPDVRESLRIKK